MLKTPGKPQVGDPVKIDMNYAELQQCGKCNNTTFIQAYHIYVIPAVANQTGRPITHVDPMVQCTSCGRVCKPKDVAKGDNGQEDES